MQRKGFENYSERRTRRVLDVAVTGSGHWVNAKTRLEDTIAVDPTDPADERLFVRHAHFDYTIHRESTNVPLWAIEFDGPQHTTDVRQQQRDILKNRVCAKAGLPLLRIDDRFLEAQDKHALLVWLVQRWIAYDREMDRRLAEQDAEIARTNTDELRNLAVLPPELDVEFLFDLDHPYPPLTTIAHRLLTRYGIAEEQAVELGGHKVEDIRRPDWTLWLPHGGPLPDLRSRYAFHTRTYCEVELRRTGQSWNAQPVFAACGEYLARVAYPVRDGQRDAFDIIDPTTREAVSPPAGPPYGGSPWAVGPMLAWYHALKQVEDWAKRNLPRVDR